MDNTRQMALRQNINLFCKKYKYAAEMSDVKHLMKSVLENMSLSNFMDSRVNTEETYIRATVTFLGDIVVKDGFFTTEQLHDLGNIGSEIKLKN
jgi:hypothetical protein